MYNDLLGKTEMKDDNENIVISIKKDLILDLYCLHGESAVKSIPQVYEQMLTEQITNLIKENEGKIGKRREELMEKLKKESARRKNARNKN